MYAMYECDIDVAAPADKAAAVVREMIYEKAAAPRLMKVNGPAGGNPVVRVRLQARPMVRFLKCWYKQDVADEWLLGQTNPPLPLSLLGT